MSRKRINPRGNIVDDNQQEVNVPQPRGSGMRIIERVKQENRERGGEIKAFSRQIKTMHHVRFKMNSRLGSYKGDDGLNEDL